MNPPSSPKLERQRAQALMERQHARAVAAPRVEWQPRWNTHSSLINGQHISERSSLELHLVQEAAGKDTDIGDNVWLYS